MDTYIIRIYRRGSQPIDITGIVETVGMDENEKFKSFDELKEILIPAKGTNRKNGGQKWGRCNEK